MQDFSHIPTNFPKGCQVRPANSDKTYTVVGYLTKNGVVSGSMITVANEEGTKFMYGASKLERV